MTIRFFLAKTQSQPWGGCPLVTSKDGLAAKAGEGAIRQSDRCGSSFRKKFSVSQFCQETKQGKESLTSLEELKSQ